MQEDSVEQMAERVLEEVTVDLWKRLTPGDVLAVLNALSPRDAAGLAVEKGGMVRQGWPWPYEVNVGRLNYCLYAKADQLADPAARPAPFQGDAEDERRTE